MSEDIASLGIAVDTTSVKAASKELDNLTNAADRAEQSTKKLGSASGVLNVTEKDVADYQKILYEQRIGMTAAEDAAQAKVWALANGYKEVNGVMVKAKDITHESAGMMQTLGLNTQYARRELLTLGREGLSGNFSRLPVTFGSLVAHSNLLAALLNPITIGIVGIGAAAIGTAIAIYKYNEELDKMNSSLFKSGDYSGKTAENLMDMASAVSISSRLTVGQAKEMEIALAGNGKIGAESFHKVEEAIAAYTAASGDAVDKVVPLMTKLFDDPSKQARALNDSMHLLTGEQLYHIDILQQQGDVQGAAGIALETLTKKAKEETKSLGYLASAWLTLKKRGSEFLDWAGSVGAEQSPLERATKARAELDEMDRAGISQMSERYQQTQKYYNLQLMLMDVERKRGEQERKVADENKTAQERLDLAKENSELWKQYQIRVEIAKLTGASTTGVRAPTQAEMEAEALNKLNEQLHGDPFSVQRQGAQEWSKAITALIGAEDEAGASTDKLSKSQKILVDYMNSGAYALNEQLNPGINRAIESQFLLAQAAEETARIQKEEIQGKQIIIGLEKSFQTELEKRQLAMQQANMTPEQKQLSSDLMSIEKQAQKSRIALESLFKDDQSSSEYAKRLKEVNDLEAAQRDAVIALNHQQELLNQSWEYGATNAMEAYARKSEQTARNAEAVWSNMLNNMTDGLTQFVMTGSMDFRKFADSVIADLIRIQIQKAITGIFGSIMTLGAGTANATEISGQTLGSSGVYQSAIPGMAPTPYADGGVVTSPTISLSGEAGPEAIMPLMRGSDGKLGIKTQGGAAMHLVYSPTIHIDSRTDRADVERLVTQAVKQGNATLVDTLTRQKRI
jgi:lambda family phage tail tape measure protein